MVRTAIFCSIPSFARGACSGRSSWAARDEAEPDEMNELEDEKLRLRILFSDDDDGIQRFEDVLDLLHDSSLLPRPNELRTADGLKYRIDGFAADLVAKNLASSFDSMLPFQLLNGADDIQTISPPDTIFSTTQAGALPRTYVEDCLRLVRRIATTTKPKFVNCCFHEISRKIYFENFEFQDRTPVSPNLEWLQYYGPQEYQRQGGDAMLANPYIQAKRLGEGVLIQVGASPEVAFTSEGRELLVNATRAMPSLRESDEESPEQRQ